MPSDVMLFPARPRRRKPDLLTPSTRSLSCSVVMPHSATLSNSNSFPASRSPIAFERRHDTSPEVLEAVVVRLRLAGLLFVFEGDNVGAWGKGTFDRSRDF